MEPDRNVRLWHASYVQTYLERDVRSLRQVGDLTSFQAFLRALAIRSGQLLQLSDLSRDLGVAVNTGEGVGLRAGGLVSGDRLAALFCEYPQAAGQDAEGVFQQVYFWRTSSGTEVDFIVETGGKLVPIEVKLSATPRPAMADAIRAFQADMGERAAGGYVVHPGDTRPPLGSGATALPYGDL